MHGQCHCGRQGNGRYYCHPRVNNCIVPACSGLCADVLVAIEGDVMALNNNENHAVFQFVNENIADLKRMDFSNSDVGDFCEFFAWAHELICKRGAEIYGKTLDESDVPF